MTSPVINYEAPAILDSNFVVQGLNRLEKALEPKMKPIDELFDKTALLVTVGRVSCIGKMFIGIAGSIALIGKLSLRLLGNLFTLDLLDNVWLSEKAVEMDFDMLCEMFGGIFRNLLWILAGPPPFESRTVEVIDKNNHSFCGKANNKSFPLWKTAIRTAKIVFGSNQIRLERPENETEESYQDRVANCWNEIITRYNVLSIAPDESGFYNGFEWKVSPLSDQQKERAKIIKSENFKAQEAKKDLERKLAIEKALTDEQIAMVQKAKKDLLDSKLAKAEPLYTSYWLSSKN